MAVGGLVHLADAVGHGPFIAPLRLSTVKIDADERLLIWIWSRSLVNWFRIAAWSWIG